MCVQIHLDGNRIEELDLPLAALHLLSSALVEIGKGHTVSLMPVHQEVTTEQAAELLGVSRPFLLKLLDSGELPFRPVGAQKHIRLAELLDYKRGTTERRLDALAQLAEQAQKLNMGY